MCIILHFTISAFLSTPNLNNVLHKTLTVSFTNENLLSKPVNILCLIFKCYLNLKLCLIFKPHYKLYPNERRLLIMVDPRDKALQDYHKKLPEHKEIDGRLKGLREQLKDLSKQY